MNVHLFGQPASFAKLNPGTCFVFDLDDKAYIGIKISEQFGDQAAASCTVIWPGHPDLGKKPGFLNDNLVSGGSVLALPDAILVPSLDPAEMHPGNGINFEAGQLFVSGTSVIMVVAGNAQRTTFVDIDAGKTIKGPVPSPWVWYSAWRLVHKWLNDEYEMICSYKMAGAGEVGFKSH